MHILILTTSFPSSSEGGRGRFYGGSFVLAEALAYSSAGANVTVLTPHAPGLPLREAVQPRLEVIRFPYFLPKRWQKVRIANLPLYTTECLFIRILQLPLFVLAFFLSILSHIGKIDLIHANWTPTALLALPFKFFFGIPIVLTYRGTDLRIMPEFINRFIVRQVNAVMDIGGGVGRSGRCRKKFSARYLRLPIITRTPEIRAKRTGNRGEKIVFTFIGRLDNQDLGPLKGLDIIIPASKKLREHYRNFEVHVVGDGPSRLFLERQLREYGVDEHVRIHGHQDNVFPFLLESDAVIGALGLNAVAQESAFSKALLLMPNISEWTGEVWAHRENALLYRSRDADSLAEAMAFVITNRQESVKIAENGYLTIKNYITTEAEGGELYLGAFRELIEEARKRNFHRKVRG